MRTLWRAAATLLILLLGAWFLARTVHAQDSGRTAARPARGAAAVDDGRELVTIRVYNHAQVADAVLARAVADAQAILQDAGVASEWRECWREPSGIVLHEACLLEPGPRDLYVKVLPSLRGLRLKNPETLGVTLGSAQGFASVAYVSYERVTAIAASDPRNHPARILGLALAHEVGHLLLNSGAHSERGLMRATWFSGGIAEAAAIQFQFTEQQAAQLRTGVRRRTKNLETLAKANSNSQREAESRAASKRRVSGLNFAGLP